MPSQPSAADRRVEYKNTVSRLLLSRQWQNQHAIPKSEPVAQALLMGLLGRTVLRQDISNIRIVAPIFIIGTPRCGSTMLMQLLGCHERIAYFTHSMNMFRDPRAFHAVNWFRKALDLDVRGERYLGDSIVANADSPSEAIRFWGESFKLDPHALTWPQRRIGDFTPSEVEHVRTAIRHVIACFREQGADRFLSKTPPLLTEVLLLQDLFPDARFIHLVRDGRMTANSLVKLCKVQREQDRRIDHPLFREKPFIPYPRVPGLEEAVKRWGAEDLRTAATVWNSALDFVESVKPQLTHFHQLRYEDLLTHPQEELAKVFAFCNLSLPQREREAYERQIGTLGKISHINRYSGFDVVERIAGDNLRKLGYL